MPISGRYQPKNEDLELSKSGKLAHKNQSLVDEQDPENSDQLYGL